MPRTKIAAYRKRMDEPASTEPADPNATKDKPTDTDSILTAGGINAQLLHYFTLYRLTINPSNASSHSHTFYRPIGWLRLAMTGESKTKLVAAEGIVDRPDLLKGNSENEKAELLELVKEALRQLKEDPLRAMLMEDWKAYVFDM